MARFLKHIGRDVYIDGFHVLALIQKLVRLAPKEVALGSGTPDDPYTMTTPAQWISSWRKEYNERKKQISYYKLGGRLILKNESLYVSDIGPAYLKGVSIETATKKAVGSLPGLGTIDGSTEKTSWMSRNTIHQPTYLSGARKIVAPGLIYGKDFGGNRPTSWSQVRYNPILTRAIRNLLRGIKLSLVTTTGGYDRNYSRKQFMLPVFTAAIFYSEPARNERAWPINLMLLDLAESGQANNFTWDAILWHPEAINPAPDKQVTSSNPPLMGPKGENPSERGLVAITGTDKLYLVGGILPSSPKGGGRFGKPALFEASKKDPLPLGKVATGIPFDYIHQKELDVLFRWLFHFSVFSQRWSIHEGNLSKEQKLIDSKHVLGAPSTDPVLDQDLRAIETKISQRCASLDFMC